MIPRRIHYCWFGKKSKSDLALQCMASWKKFCPDFEFMEWNENNSQQFQNKFYKDAYRRKQYAFVADCVRVQALYAYGGIYLDLDMLLLKPIDKLLQYKFFTGFEVTGRPAYGIFGGEPQHRFFRAMKQFYDEQYFNPFSPPVITHTFKNLITNENLGSSEKIFNPEVFYALPYESRTKEHTGYTTPNSLAVHLWDHSWQQPPKNTVKALFTNLWMVQVDTVFYNYPTQYWKRYTREYTRKLYHKIFGNND